MMFDKDLFFSLCEKYNVELSDSAKQPMMKGSSGIHTVTDEDVNRVFVPCQNYFEYSGKKLDANVITEAYHLWDDFAIAC